MAANIKYPKPEKFYGDPGTYRSWITDVELYYTAAGITQDADRINYALILLAGAADEWKQNFIHQNVTIPNAPGLGTWQAFKTALQTSFQPASVVDDAYERISVIRQNGEHIDRYIARFSVLASEAGLTDQGPLCHYFRKGLDPEVRRYALQQNPQTVEQWKTHARNAAYIAREIGKDRRTSESTSYRSRKGRKGSNISRSFKPRYNGGGSKSFNAHCIKREPMENDHINMVINKLHSGDIEDDDDDSSESDSEHSSDQQDDSDDEINFVHTKSAKHKSSPDAVERALINLLQKLSPGQRKAMAREDCFWCEKPGHWYRDCKARKAYQEKQRAFEKSNNSRGQGKSFQRSRPSRPIKGKGKQNPRRKVNNLIVNLMKQLGEDESDESDNEESDQDF